MPFNLLRRIDMNLIVALDALLQESNVTRAAAQLGVTQSAMSQSLNRLRQTLDDPILVRSGRQMVPSPRALALRDPLRGLLAELGRTLAAPTQFAPREAKRAFRLAMLETYAYTQIPRLTHQIASESENLTLEVLSLDTDTLWGELRSGSVDLAMAGNWALPEDMDRIKLFDDQVGSMVRSGHPILESEITPETYSRYPHVAFHLRRIGRHPVDEQLEQLGHPRRTVCRLPYFLLAPIFVDHDETIVNLPLSVARAYARELAVETFLPPLPSLGYSVFLVWSKAHASEPGLQWFKEQVLSLHQVDSGS